MTTLAHVRGLKSEGGILGLLCVPHGLGRCLWAGVVAGGFLLTSARGADDQLNKVHVTPPPVPRRRPERQPVRRLPQSRAQRP